MMDGLKLVRKLEERAKDWDARTWIGTTKEAKDFADGYATALHDLIGDLIEGNDI